MTGDAHLDGPSFQRFLGHVEAARGGTVTQFRPIAGGYSRLSALAEVRWADGSQEAFVLRADPPAETGVFDSDRDAEWRLLRALEGKLPVRTPTPRWYDATGEYFGAKCLIVDFFHGRPLFEFAQSPDQLPWATGVWVDTFCQAHQTPLDVLPAELERPASWESYIDDLVGLVSRLDGAVADSNPFLHYVAAVLREHRPPPVPLALVHGDAQPTNILVPEQGPVLLIDWEFGRIGDPREDLGFYSYLPVPPNLYGADPQGFLARYRERSGLSEEQVNEDTVSYFYILGQARLLGQQIDAADALTRGRPRGVMATYLISSISVVTQKFLEIARRLAEQP
jgi:aminoglycoside phosphotransferase (APT) family kinase protein